MKLGHLARRLVSPAGFVLAGLCFLLPFVAVSCETSTEGKTYVAAITLDGTDLIAGGYPDISFPTEQSEGQPAAYTVEDATTNPMDQPIERTEPQSAAIVTLCLMAGGVLAAILPRSRLRRIAAGTLALAAGLTAYGAYLQAKSMLLRRLDSYLSDGANPVSTLGEHIVPRYGFWLMLGLLVLLGLANLGAALAKSGALPSPPANDPDVSGSV